jgi:hypothetical protein
MELAVAFLHLHPRDVFMTFMESPLGEKQGLDKNLRSAPSYCATNRKVTGSTPDEVDFFQLT